MRILILLLYFMVTVNFVDIAWNQCYAATYDSTGTWSYSLTNEGIDPPCTWNRPLDGTVVVTQTGVSVQAVDNYNGATYTGTVSGTNYTMSGSYPDEGGTTTITINLTLTSSTSGSGSWTVHWTNGTNSCNGGADISITKTSVSMDIVHVDFTYTGTESGTQSQPFNTLAEAINAVAVGGEIIIKGGVTSETFTGLNKIDKEVTIKSSGGTATIGKQ